MSDATVPLGPDLVRRLLPHRHPLLLVDAVDACTLAPRALLRAHRHIALDEPVFAGHFPNRAVWPGVYTIEGLAQSCQLLATIAALARSIVSEGRNAGEPLALVREWDRAAQIEVAGPSAAPGGGRGSALPQASFIGLMAAADVRFVEPVGAGQRLDYVVAEAALQPSETLARYQVDAECEGRPVARGVLVLTRPPVLARATPP